MPKTCTVCGTVNVIQAGFCQDCGRQRFGPPLAESASATANPIAPPPVAAAKKSSSAVGFCVLIAIVLVGYGYLRGSDSDGSSVDNSGPIDTSVEVTYEVDGSSSSADLTISTPGGGTSQRGDSAVPLTNKSGTAGLIFTFDSGEFVYISAQRGDDNSGDITCHIKVGGIEIATETSSGPYSIATCSGET